jgi:3-methyladenine DNA glycosylase AlkD
MPMQAFIEELQQLLISKTDGENAAAMSAYMKNKFLFLGIKKPKRAVLTKPFLSEMAKSYGSTYPEVVLAFWEMPEREFQYVAMDFLWKVKRHWHAEHVWLCERLIVSKSWWDTVDFLAVRALGEYLKDKPELLHEKIAEWASSRNLWLNRTAILVQLKYKTKTNRDWLLEAIMPHVHSKEFFHQKAIGWALREYAYTDLAWVKSTCEAFPLSNLSIREALKHNK